MLYTGILLLFLPPPLGSNQIKSSLRPLVPTVLCRRVGGVHRPPSRPCPAAKLARLWSLQRERRTEQRFRRCQPPRARVAALSHVNSRWATRASTYPRRAGGRTYLQASRPRAPRAMRAPQFFFKSKNFC
jgi:hypothetical protein